MTKSRDQVLLDRANNRLHLSLKRQAKSHESRREVSQDLDKLLSRFMDLLRAINEAVGLQQEIAKLGKDIEGQLASVTGHAKESEELAADVFNDYEDVATLLFNLETVLQSKIEKG